MLYLNTIEQVFCSVEQLNQLEVCLTYSRLLAGIQILAVYRNLGWNSNKTSLNNILPHRAANLCLKFNFIPCRFKAKSLP